MSSTPTTAEQWMERAASLERNVENEELPESQALTTYTEAASAYASADRLKPNDPACLYNWGRVLFILGGFVDGERDPDAKLQHVTSAINKFEQSVTLKPENTDALFNLAQALATHCDLVLDADGDRAVGESLLKRAIELFDRVYKLQEAQLAQSEDSEDKSTLIDTVSAVVECITSLATLQDEEHTTESDALFDDACKRLERALPLCPARQADILCDWAAVLEAKANHQQDEAERMDASLYEPAIAKLKEAIAAGPDQADPHCDLGDLYLGIAHGKLIEATLDADLEADEETGSSEAAAKQKAAADNIITVDSDITPFYDMACAAFKKAARIESENVGIKQKLGDICFARSRLPLASAESIEKQLLADAESWYRQALEKAPEDSDVIIRLAQVLDVNEAHTECETLLGQWAALGGSVEELYEEDDVFELEFLEKVAKRFGAAAETSASASSS